MTVSGWCGPLHQSELWASWTEAFGANMGWVVSGIAIIVVWKTWRSTQRQLTEAQRQTDVARQQAKSAREALEIERNRDQDRLSTERRAQAEQVACWLTGALDSVVLRNGSSQPIFRVKVGVQLRLNVTTVYEKDVIAPRMEGSQKDIGVPLPGELPERLREHSAAQEIAGAVITFLDIRGRDWSRRVDGDLVPAWDAFIPTYAERELKAMQLAERPL